MYSISLFNMYVYVKYTGLMIGKVDEIQKIHIQSHPLNEAPRRIIHSKQSNIFAVLTEKTTITERGEESLNRVLFLGIYL